MARRLAGWALALPGSLAALVAGFGAWSLYGSGLSFDTVSPQLGWFALAGGVLAVGGVAWLGSRGWATALVMQGILLLVLGLDGIQRIRGTWLLFELDGIQLSEEDPGSPRAGIWLVLVTSALLLGAGTTIRGRRGSPLGRMSKRGGRLRPPVEGIHPGPGEGAAG
jgi:hypothetical protein